MGAAGCEREPTDKCEGSETAGKRESFVGSIRSLSGCNRRHAQQRMRSSRRPCVDGIHANKPRLITVFLVHSHEVLEPVLARSTGRVPNVDHQRDRRSKASRPAQR